MSLEPGRGAEALSDNSSEFGTDTLVFVTKLSILPLLCGIEILSIE
jgi:hypothetical protein